MGGSFPLPVGSQGWRLPDGMEELRLPAQFGLAVVGESQHQGALARAAGGRVADVSDGHFENAISVTACLVPEPGNRDDPDAVAVTVDDELVGYLPESAARAWQPVLLKAWDRGRFVTCHGSISGGGPVRSYGIFLTVCRPVEVEFVATAPDMVLPVIGSATVTVVGEQDHPDALAGLRPHQAVAATLHRATSGRSARPGTAADGSGPGPEPLEPLEVRIAGNRVGELTPGMSERYEALVAGAESQGRTLACRAHLGEDHRGPQVTLSLPSEDELAGPTGDPAGPPRG